MYSSRNTHGVPAHSSLILCLDCCPSNDLHFALTRRAGLWAEIEATPGTQVKDRAALPPVVFKETRRQLPCRLPCWESYLPWRRRECLGRESAPGHPWPPALPTVKYTRSSCFIQQFDIVSCLLSVEWLAFCIFADKSRSTVRITGDKAAQVRREISRILDRHRDRHDDPRRIKETKGTGAYLAYIGSMTGVQYPQHWKREDGEVNPRISRDPLPPQSVLYQQILKLINGTWDPTKVGIGFDGVGLSHSKIIVKQIYVCKNVALFRQYDMTRKIMCMDASVNRYTPVRGSQGEEDVFTRELITGNSLQLKFYHI